MDLFPEQSTYLHPYSYCDDQNHYIEDSGLDLFSDGFLAGDHSNITSGSASPFTSDDDLERYHTAQPYNYSARYDDGELRPDLTLSNCVDQFVTEGHTPIKMEKLSSSAVPKKSAAAPCTKPLLAQGIDHKRTTLQSPQSVVQKDAQMQQQTKRKLPNHKVPKTRNGCPPKVKEEPAITATHNNPNSGRKTALAAHVQSPVKESKWSQRLLKGCALAITQNNLARAQHLMWVLNDVCSFTGDVNQRLAAYGLMAFFSTVGDRLTLPPLVHTPPPVGLEVSLCSLTKFHDASPWHIAIYTMANWALLEACEGHDKIHVIDVGVSQGTQWPTFIQELATRVSGPPSFARLTMVHEPSLQGSSSIDFVSCKLEAFAKKLGLKLQIQNIFSPLESLSSDELSLQGGEELVISAQFRLHYMSNELGDDGKPSKRDQFLRFIQDLNPNTFVLSENDTDHCSGDFYSRFERAMEFQWSFLDSTADAFQGQDTDERHVIEQNSAVEFVNTVACEAAARCTWNENHRAWSARANRAGFSSYLLSAEAFEVTKWLLRKHSSQWDLVMEDGTAVLRWKGQPTTFCSLWRPTYSYTFGDPFMT